MLQVENLVAGYAGSRVLDGVELDVAEGSALALLGRNGVGKTTLISTVMGMLRPSSGTVHVAGANVTGARAHRLVHAGVAIVPQGRRVFAPLTVEENLRVALRGCRRRGPGPWDLTRVFEMMPRLAERRHNRGSQLSGGEQQMLAIGRALLSNPRLLLLDEPSDGLAPAVVRQVGDVLAGLTDQGMSVLIVEQDLRLAFRVADAVAVMQKGRIVHRASTADFRRDQVRAHELLGVG